MIRFVELLLAYFDFHHAPTPTQRRATISATVIDLTEDVDMEGSSNVKSAHPRIKNEVIDISTDDDNPEPPKNKAVTRSVTSVTSGIENFHVGTSTASLDRTPPSATLEQKHTPVIKSEGIDLSSGPQEIGD
jgi:hypothetical protein